MKVYKELHTIFTTRFCLCLFAGALLFVNKVQANADSLSHIWIDVIQSDSARFQSLSNYYNQFVFSQPDSVIRWSDYHIELAQQKNSDKERAVALNFKAIAYNIKGEPDDALLHMKKALGIYSNLNDSIALIKTYNNLANIYNKRLNFKEAISYYSKCINFYEKNNHEELLASSFMNLGLIYIEVSDYDLALDYFSKSRDKYTKLKLANTKGNLWTNFGNANFGKKNYNKALEDCKRALAIYKSPKESSRIANTYSLMAQIYQELNQIDTAFVYINKSLKLHQSIGDNKLVLVDRIILANLFRSSDINKAARIGKEVLKEMQKYRDYSLKMKTHDLLYECYKEEGKYPLALSMLEMKNTYSDSLDLEQDRIVIAQKVIQTEYETKIFNEKVDNERSETQLKLNQLKLTLCFSFLFLSVILFTFFYFRSKRILHNRQKEVLENELNHLKKIEDARLKLIESDKMASLGQLTAGVAHEINNPINFISNGIKGLKQLLEKYIDETDDNASDSLEGDMNDMINAIEEGANRTNNIVRSLRLFSREDFENYIKLDIVASLESAFSILSNKFQQNIFLEKNIEKKELFVYGYSSQINQVFINILMNAIHAVGDSGIIKVVVKELQDNIFISICDTGEGVPDELKQKIFEPFYTTKKVHEGTGLGLSITFGIIKKHKGTIEVKDNKPKGAKFLINLPKRDVSLINNN